MLHRPAKSDKTMWLVFRCPPTRTSRGTQPRIRPSVNRKLWGKNPRLCKQARYVTDTLPWRGDHGFCSPRRTARHGRSSSSPWLPDRQPEGACTRLVEPLGPSSAGSWSPAGAPSENTQRRSRCHLARQRAVRRKLRRFLITGEDLGVHRRADDSGRTAGKSDAIRAVDDKGEDGEGNPAMPPTVSGKSRSHTTMMACRRCHRGLPPWCRRVALNLGRLGHCCGGRHDL